MLWSSGGRKGKEAGFLPRRCETLRGEEGRKMDGETKLTWTQMGSVGMNDSPIQHRFGRTATAPSIMQIASVGCAAVDTLLHLASRLVRWPEASEASFSEVLGTPEPLCSTQLQRASRRTSVRVSAQCGHNRGGPSSLRSEEKSTFLCYLVAPTPNANTWNRG